MCNFATEEKYIFPNFSKNVTFFLVFLETNYSFPNFPVPRMEYFPTTGVCVAGRVRHEGARTLPVALEELNKVKSTVPTMGFAFVFASQRVCGTLVLQNEGI